MVVIVVVVVVVVLWPLVEVFVEKILVVFRQVVTLVTVLFVILAIAIGDGYWHGVLFF